MRRIRAVAAGVAVGVVGVVLLAGCGAGNKSTDDASSGSRAVAPVQKPAGTEGSDGKAAPEQPQSAGKSQSTGNGQDEPTITLAIIKTGSLTVEGDDVSAMRQKAITAIAGRDGQVASEDTGSDPDGECVRVRQGAGIPRSPRDACRPRAQDSRTRPRPATG